MKKIFDIYAPDKITAFLSLKLHGLWFRVKRFAGLKRNLATPCEYVDSAGSGFRPLLTDEIVVLAHCSFDADGGRHRSSQLAKAALKTGRRVYYLYLTPAPRDGAMVSNDDASSLVQLHGATIVAADLFDHLSVHAVLIFDIPHPLYLPYLEQAEQRGLHTVYESIQHWENYDWFAEDAQRQFIVRSRCVIAISGQLLDDLKVLGRDDAFLLPDAADADIFSPYRSHPVPTEYEQYLPYRKRFVSVGDHGIEPIDWKYVVRAALDNPDAGFFFIGAVPDPGGLPANIHFLGTRRIEELPSYLEHADGALLPLVPDGDGDPGIASSLYEYLFMGKPVVATLLPHLPLHGVVQAASEKEFSEQCRSIERFLPDQSERETFIAVNSWHARLTGILPPDKSSGRVTAVFLIHNNATIIGRALRTLLHHCSYLLNEVIVVDNASSDGGGDFVRASFPEVTLLSNERNGCSSGRNLALDRAVGDYIVFLDSDQWFTSGSFITEALAILDAYPKIGAVGWGAGWFSEKRGNLGGPIVDDLPKRGMNTPEATILGFRTDIAYLATCGLVVPRPLAQQTEGFDTNYDPTCFEDTDFSFQLKNLGYHLAYRDLTGIQHQPHQTTNARSCSAEYRRLFRKNARYFRRKWSGHPEYFVDLPGEDGC